VLWIGQVAVVTLPAEIDVTNADSVREDLLAVLNHGAALLIADLSNTTFCDSAGVSALVRTFTRAAASDSGMRLVVSTPAVQRVLSEFGYGQIRTSGILDEATIAAIGKFESDHKLPVTGRLSNRLLSELGALTGHPIE